MNITAAGETVKVERGEGSLIEKGKSPSAPRKLLAKPDMTAMTLNSTAAGVVVEWPQLAGATAYRYQLTNAEPRMVAVGTTVSNRMKLPSLGAGDYQITVRGIDDLGFEGFDAQHDFSLQPTTPTQKQDEPAGLVKPTLSQPQFSGYGIHLRWTQVVGAWAYRLYLARDAGLKDVLFTRLSEDTRFILQPLPPGRYFIGIEALSATNDEHSRSNIYQIGMPAWR